MFVEYYKQNHTAIPHWH